MSEKNDYKIDFDDIVLRRARENDNMEDIARLIYQTDPYIYPFWFNNDINEAIKVLKPRLFEPGFIFNYENCYVAYSKEHDKILGLVCAIDPTTNLDYDYSELASVNENYNFTINNYIKVLINEVIEKKYMYFVNVCVDEQYRSMRIGSRMLENFIKQMHGAGFIEICFDCLMHNLRAKNLYHSLGFKEVSEGFGFDGTDNSTVEIVFFKKKSVPFTKEDFQMLPSTNVKDNDLKREAFIYKALTTKKSLQQ